MSVHFKMYKKGKKWVAAMLFAAGALAIGTTGYADQLPTNTGAAATNRAANAEVITQPTAGAASSTVTSTDSAGQQSTLPDIYDGNITISGPDQNQGQRDQLNQQLDQAKQTTAQAQAAYQKLADQSSSYQNAVNAKQNYDAAYKKAGQIQYYDLVGHQLPERRDSLNKQADQLNKRAQEQEQRAENARKQQAELEAQLKTATAEQAATLNAQIKQLAADYVRANRLYGVYSNRSTGFMNQAQKISNQLTDLLLNGSDGYQYDPDFDASVLKVDTSQPSWLTTDPAGDYQTYQEVMQSWLSLARKAGFDSVDVYYQYETSQVKDPNSLQRALHTAKQEMEAAETRQTTLQDQVNALPVVRQASRPVTRMLVFTLPGGQTEYHYQTVTLHGQAQILNGQITYSNWETAEWPEYTPAAIPGYLAPTVPAMTVDGSTTDQTASYEYQARTPQQEEDHGQIEKVELQPGRGESDVILGVTGWHTTTASRSLPHTYLLLKDQTTGEILDAEPYVPLASPDVATKYPNIANSDHAAFSVPLRLSRSQLSDKLVIIVRYTDGDSVDEGRHKDYLFQLAQPDMGNYAQLEQAVLENGQLRVTGWHATNKAPGSTHSIILYDVTQGRQLAQKAVENGEQRDDIAKQYPTIFNAGHAGFAVDFAVDPAMLTDELQVISRWSSNDMQSGVDYSFTLPRLLSGTTNNAWLDREEVCAGQLQVAGWHATNLAIGKLHHVIILYDTSRHRELTRKEVANVQRPDLVKVYPQVFNASIAGFNVSFDLDPAMLTDQVQVISRWYGEDQNRDYVDYWFPAKQVLAGTANNAWLDQVSLASGQLHVAGWHATNQALHRRYHTIIVYDTDQNRELARQTVRLGQRDDVAKVYPQVANADDSGFATNFVLANAMATDRIQIISRWSKGPDANSDYVDYWFAPQRLLADRNNYANLDSMTDVRDKDGRYRLKITGWNATNLSMGRQYHYLIAINQNTGKEIARQLVQTGSERGDVARAFPMVVNAGNSGFEVAFTITPELAQANIAFISRWTDDPAGNGDFVDYWFKPALDQSGYGYLDSRQISPAASGEKVLRVSGWQASDLALLRPYHTLILFDNTSKREVGRVANIDAVARPDVARVYPNLRTANHSGFADITFPVQDCDPNDDFTIISRYAASADSNRDYVDNYYFHLGRL